MADPGGQPPRSEPGFRLFLKFFKERKEGSSLVSEACKSLYRRRFKEIEDAPFVAYLIAC